ncbi:MAG: tRNA (adenosine(37)-N6)-threonylcarbamoyltransferase complex transferase subunit TsaD [Acetobacteraceae bacterium]
MPDDCVPQSGSPGPPLGPVLGIETSCDETAAAILDSRGNLLSERLLSQRRDHAPYGGVVPEIAARAHLTYLPGLVREAMTEARLAYPDLAAVAATAGPGLIGGLIVGSNLAKGIALQAGCRFLAINHLEAHALTPRLPGLGGADFPYLLLLVSGGHSQWLAVEGIGRYRLLGQTIDDAAGEAFDKVGKLLGLSWPGGPALERLAAIGNPRRFRFPRPLAGRPGCNFSFSGLKTAVAQAVAQFAPGPLTRVIAADLAASFQSAVVDVLVDRARNAIALFASRHPEARLLVASGGVAANHAIRTALAAAAADAGFSLVAPPARLCTDNAVMVAWAGLERLRLGCASAMDAPARPRWPLEELSG